MQRNAEKVSFFLIVCILLVACGQSQAERNAQETALALSIAQTQTSQAPTITPKPTRTPKPTPTLTPTRPPSRTPPPTPEMLTYSNAEWSYSILYPSIWLVMEEQAYTSFQSSVEADSWVLITVYYTARKEQALIDDAIASDKEKGDLKEILSKGTKTFNGLSWRYVIYSTNSSTFMDLYARIDANGRAYMFFGSSNNTNHDRLTKIFEEMMESFR